MNIFAKIQFFYISLQLSPIYSKTSRSEVSSIEKKNEIYIVLYSFNIYVNYFNKEKTTVLNQVQEGIHKTKADISMAKIFRTLLQRKTNTQVYNLI